MGWTSMHVETKYKGRKEYIDRKEECDKLFNQSMVTMESNNPIGKYEVLHSSVVGNTYYAAVKKTKFATETNPEESVVFAAIVLTSTRIKEHYNFSYKDMDETCGPHKYDCPNVILDMLSPTDNEYANEWRKKCREKTAEKNSPTALHNLPIGTKIKFIAPFDMKIHNKGDEIVVWKAKKGYKNTTYWIDGHFAYPAKVIGTEYEIIEEE